MFTDADVISVYSRAQAISDGVLVDVTEVAKRCGWGVPVALTSSVYTAVAGARGSGPLDAKLLRLRWLLLEAKGQALEAPGETDRFHFTHYSDVTRQTHHLWALCGPGDTPDPVVTIMMEGED